MTRPSRKRLTCLATVTLVPALGVVGSQIWAPTQKAEAFPVDALSLGNSHGVAEVRSLSGSDRVHLMQLDLASQGSIRAFVRTVGPRRQMIFLHNGPGSA